MSNVFGDRPLIIWTNMGLSATEAEWLRGQIVPHTLFVAGSTASNLVSGSRDLNCQSADVAFGQPAVEDLLESASLRWVQLTSAGYTRYDRDDVKTHLRDLGGALTNSSGVYDDPCAHQVLAFMFEHNRSLHTALGWQQMQTWAYSEMRAVQRVLTGQSAVIVGYGAIGRRLTELLAPYRMRLVGIRRRVQGDEAIPTFRVDEIGDHLSDADHVVNLLPANASTEKIFSEFLFSRFKPGAAFYNVGRGDTVDQLALIAALERGQVGAAYLDVATPEPLPTEHPLWTAPNTVITPHVAGGVQDESQRLLDHFVGNFRRLLSGGDLVDRIV